MDTNKKGLGRGLEALIPKTHTVQVQMPKLNQGAEKIAIELIFPSDSQPRQIFQEKELEELAQSIREHGVIQPILVRQRNAQHYEIVAGERRWRAAQRAGLKEIPVVISAISKEKSLAVALVENMQRADLNPIEEAEAIRKLMDVQGLNQNEVSAILGKDRSTVANTLRLLHLPEKVRDLVLKQSLTMGHAKALLSLESPQEINDLAQRAIAEGYSVRKLESVVNAGKNEKPKKKSEENPLEKDLRMRLQKHFGSKVDLQNKKGHGKIVVHFASYGELDHIMKKIGL